MSTLADSVSRRYLKRASIRTAVAEEKVVPPARFMDLILFDIAYKAYTKWLEAQGQDPNKDPQVRTGFALLRRFTEDFELAFEQHIKPLGDRPDAASIRAALIMAQRPGTVQVQGLNRATFFLKLFSWLRARPNLLGDLFPGRANRAAKLLVQLADEETPEALLYGLAGIPASSTLTTLTKWAKTAAKAAGSAPGAVAESLTDAKSAEPLAEALRRVEGDIQAATPMTPEYADLQEKKQQVVEQLDDLAQNSPDPGVVVSAVAATSTSAVAKEAGLNEEQTAALLAEGRVVITAGAGAGKTRVMAAKVAYFVREKGYRPDQILATSFTAKSAKELEERVRDLYGITDSRIGTTHSIAREILFDFTKIDRQVIMKATQGGAMNTLMELAVKQVGMKQSTGGYGGYGGGGYGGGGGNYGRKYPRRYAAFGGPSTPYWKTPVGQWFNLGQDPVDNRNKPIGKKRLKTAVGLFQNKRITPEQAWADNQDRKNGNVLYFAAAIYGAYTWLKHNDPQYGPAMDFDDWLVEATKVLEQDPSALDALQRRFKVVMVDEAQDLNAVQWQLFNLIAAKADTFAVVGDDKQAIYGFRGAVPAEFTGLPGKGFDVKLLSINFRSGKHIVEAANKLIAHNGDRQIPMVCRADEARKGMGQVEAVEVPRHEDGAVLAAQEISGEVETGSSPKDFGVLVRNNGEADAYCLALMSKGIPFRSKANFFGKPAVRAMMNWITIAASDNNDDTNDAVADAHGTPGFFLNREFVAGLQRRCPPGQNYLEFLVAGGRPYAGSEDWRNDKMVAPYAEVLRDIDDLRGKPMNELIEGILSIRGSKQSFLESLIDEVDPEDVAEENETLEPTDEMIRNAALSPLRPLMEMAKKYNDPAKFLGFLKKLIRANDKNRKNDDSPEPAVMVDTIHQWKGLQAKKVYVCMAAGTFPHTSTDDAAQEGDETAYDDERRLAYVAITRGEDRVTVICPGENYMGKPAGISRFVEEACIGIQGKNTKEADPDPDGDAAPVRTASFTMILDEFLTGRNGEGW